MMDSLENYYRSFLRLGLNFAVPVSSIENLDGSHPRKRKRRGFLADIVQYV